MAFVPRLTEPSTTDKHWIQVGSGGYNRCIYASGSSVLPNCTGFAQGRFMEIMGTTSCTLSTRNAGLWYGNTADGYERGKVPRLGAVICWSRPGQAGHVAIVEQINQDGSIVTSNSAWQGKRFYTQTLQPPNYTWSSNYHLQGFIYNPKGGEESGKVSALISTARKYIGKTASDLGYNDGNAWSAKFVMKCAQEAVGLLNVVIPNVTNPSELAKIGESRGMGKLHKGKGYGGTSAPEPGDIMLRRIHMVKNYETDYSCDKIGIVTEVRGDVFYVVEGDSSDRVQMNNYKVTSKEVAGYYKPDWAKVFDSPESQSLLYTNGVSGKLYDTENTKEDAVVREVGFLSSDCTPTLSKSGVRLSVVNYTTLLAAFFDDVIVSSGVPSSTGQTAILDGVSNQKARIVIEYLIGKGLNAAAAVGVTGNIKHESNFKTDAVGDQGTSFGICQWHNDRGVSMKRMAGSDWSNNLTGQLDFLWHELTTIGEFSRNVLTPLQQVPNTEAGVRTAADVFVRKFEKPAYVDTESVKRQNSAIEFWKEIALQLTTSM